MVFNSVRYRVAFQMVTMLVRKVMTLVMWPFLIIVLFLIFLMPK